jgi:hypothetical protein
MCDKEKRRDLNTAHGPRGCNEGGLEIPDQSD